MRRRRMHRLLEQRFAAAAAVAAAVVAAAAAAVAVARSYLSAMTHQHRLLRCDHCRHCRRRGLVSAFGPCSEGKPFPTPQWRTSRLREVHQRERSSYCRSQSREHYCLTLQPCHQSAIAPLWRHLTHCLNFVGGQHSARWKRRQQNKPGHCATMCSEVYAARMLWSWCCLRWWYSCSSSVVAIWHCYFRTQTLAEGLPTSEARLSPRQPWCQ